MYLTLGILRDKLGFIYAVGWFCFDGFAATSPSAGNATVLPPLGKLRSIMKKLYEKFIRHISRRLWNHTVHHIILEAMKRNILNSHQGHAILGAWNANCFPENGHRSFLHEGGRTPRALDGACTSCKLELTPRCPIRTGNGCDLYQPRQ